MKPLITAFASITLALVLWTPAALSAQGRRAPSGDGGGSSEPARTAGGRSSDSEPAPRAEPASRPDPSPRAEPPSRAIRGSGSDRAPAAGTAQSKARTAAARPGSGEPRTASAGRQAPITRPVVGLAAPRMVSQVRPVRIIYNPVYFPVSYGYGYSPWGYRNSYFGHGYWYSPFGYSYRPGYGHGYYGYYGHGHHYGYPVYGSTALYYRDDDQDEAPEGPTGSIRFRVNPSHARIYVDGALAGTVGDFNGFNDHLRLTPGTHNYELRAEGYETHTGVLKVVEGQTRTERVNLRRP